MHTYQDSALLFLAYILELPEWYKLDDVPHGRLAGSRAQNSVIPIQELHSTEVRPPHPNNDDGHGQTRGVDDGLAGVVHVCDHAVSDDEQNKVLLQEDGSGTGRRKRYKKLPEQLGFLQNLELVLERYSLQYQLTNKSQGMFFYLLLIHLNWLLVFSYFFCKTTRATSSLSFKTDRLPHSTLLGR